jgi:DNA invertase Pin-like site-specific DNA recombinase
MRNFTSKPVKAIGYCRTAISTQTEQDKDIKVQKKQISEAAKLLNAEIVEWFIQEGYEPMHFPYQALDKAHEYCEDNNPDIKYLFVTPPANLSRTLEEFHYWKVAFERTGVTIKSTDETKPTSTIEDSIIEDAYLFMVAEHEHEVRLSEIEQAIRSEKAKKV